MRCERGLLTRADGSAQWTQGGTAVLASVTGPTQAYASSKEDPERATVEVIFRPRSGLAGARRAPAAATLLRAAARPACSARRRQQDQSHAAHRLSQPPTLPCTPPGHSLSAGAAERQAEAVLRRSLEAVVVAALHPRTLIQVVVQVRPVGVAWLSRCG